MSKSTSIIPQIKSLVKSHQDIQLCILFGSVAVEQQQFDSNLDIAVAGKKPIGSAKKKELIEQLAAKFGRPVDLVDLQVTSGTLLHQILTKGKLLFCNDDTLYAGIIKKMLFNQADMMPYHNRILKERRERWINE